MTNDNLHRLRNFSPCLNFITVFYITPFEIVTFFVLLRMYFFRVGEKIESNERVIRRYINFIKRILTVHKINLENINYKI